MEYRKLGRTGIEVSVVCCGTMAMAPHRTYGQPDDDASIAAVRAALALGINFFDTAENYGDGYAEEVLGRALEGRRDEAVIATKVAPDHLRAADLVRACESSLRRLRTDRIDLYQVHWPNHQVPLAETLGALERLREKGKIIQWGVSNFGKFDLRELLDLSRPEVNQLPYSLLWRAIEHDVVPACVKNEFSIICYSPMAQGILTGKFAGPQDVPAERRRARYCRDNVIGLAFDVVAELRSISAETGEAMADIALAWLLSRPGVTSAIAGARSAEQVAENARAGELVLPQALLGRLTHVSDRLKASLDANPDMWQEGANSRYH